MKFVKIPRGVANIFSVNQSNEVTITENTQHRTDRLNNGIQDELINNWMSNTSPLRTTKGTRYKKMSSLFISYFGIKRG